MADRDMPSDALRAYRRAAQWLSLTARRDQAGLDRLKKAIGSDVAEWTNLVSSIAYLAEEQGVAQFGSPNAWAEHTDSLAASAYAMQWSKPALGAITDQVQARESRAERRRRGRPSGGNYPRDETSP